MTDIELLRLPPYIYGRELGDNEKALTLQGAERYARAVAEHNVRLRGGIDPLAVLIRAQEAEARAERLAEALRDARDRMLGQVKWVACDCGCERDKPADAVSVAWLRASALLREQENDDA